MSENKSEIPHVKTVEDGNRNVDVIKDFQDAEEIKNFLLDECELIDSGKEAWVFRRKDRPDLIVRVESFNSMGLQWTNQLIDSLYTRAKDKTEKDIVMRPAENSQLMNSRMREAKEANLDEVVTEFVERRIAAHNSQFRRDPLSTFPINATYTFRGVPFAISAKFFEFKERISTSNQKKINWDDANNTLSGVEDSQSSEVMIDIGNFIPSDQDPETVGKESFQSKTIK